MFRTCESCTARLATACVRAGACQRTPGGGAPSASVAIDIPEFELKRLDVEEGDLLVYRTRSRLTSGQADVVADRIDRHVRQLGFTNVRTIVLDDCSDLSIERPAHARTRMQHQARREPPTAMRS